MDRRWVRCACTMKNWYIYIALVFSLPLHTYLRIAFECMHACWVQHDCRTVSSKECVANICCSNYLYYTCWQDSVSPQILTLDSLLSKQYMFYWVINNLQQTLSCPRLLTSFFSHSVSRKYGILGRYWKCMYLFKTFT